MRVMMTATFPIEPFNSHIRAGTVSDIMQTILADLKPESTYFIEEDGSRCAVMIINLANESQIPKFAEPFFLHFNAKCRFQIAMTPEDLEKAGLEDLGKKWK